MEIEIKNKKYSFTKDDLVVKDKYIKNIIQQIFMYNTDPCGICLNDYKNYDEGPPVYVGNCACVMSFHRHCLQAAIEQTKSCPSCRKQAPTITQHKGNLLDIVAYENLYDIAAKVLKGEAWLYFISNWTIPIKNFDQFSKGCILNVYSFLDYTMYDPDWKNCRLFENAENCHFNKFVNCHYQLGEQSVKDYRLFMEHFQKFTYGIFDEHFKWSNVVIAGGSISKLLSAHMKIYDYPENSDVDLFVYGQNARDKEITVRRIIEYFSSKYKNKVFFLHKFGTICVYISDVKRCVQIISGEHKTIEDIIFNFDMDHVKVCYSEGNVFCAPKFLVAFRHQVTQINDDMFKFKRILKINGTGFSLLSNSHQIVQTLKYIEPKHVENYFPRSDELYENVVQQLSDSCHVAIQSITQDPNKCISFVETDVKFNKDKMYEDTSYLLNIRIFDDFKNLIFKVYKNRTHRSMNNISVKYPEISVMNFEIRNVVFNNIILLDEEHGIMSIDMKDQEEVDKIKFFGHGVKREVEAFVKHKYNLSGTVINFGVNAIILSNNKTKIYKDYKTVGVESFLKSYAVNTSRCIVSLNNIVMRKDNTLGILELRAHEIYIN